MKNGENNPTKGTLTVRLHGYQWNLGYSMLVFKGQQKSYLTLQVRR